MRHNNFSGYPTLRFLMVTATATMIMGLIPDIVYADSMPIQILSVREVPELGRKDYSICPDTAPACVADFKSIIVIDPQLSRLISSEHDSVKPMSPIIRGQREDLIGALSSFTESMKLSERLVRECPKSATASRLPVKEKECAALSDTFEKQRKSLLEGLEQYVRRDPEAFGLQPSPDKKEVRRKLGDAYSDPFKTGDWIAERLSELELDSKETSAALKNGLKKLRIRMGAFRIRDEKPPTPLHLDNYDDFESMSVKPIDRISFEVSEDQAKRMEEESKFNTALAKEVSGLRDGTSEFVAKLKKHADSLRASANKVQERVEEGIALLRGGIHAEVPEVITALKANASDSTKKNLDEIEVELQKVQERLLAYKSVIESGKSLLTNSGGTVTGSGRPDLIMVTLLGRVEAFHKGFSDKAVSDFEESINSLKRVDTILKENSKHIELLEFNTREKFASLNTSLVGELLRISSDIGNIVKSEITAQSDVVQGYNNLAGKYLKGAAPILNVDLSNPSIHAVVGDQARATSVDLGRVGCDSGDIVELAAKVEDVDGNTIHEEHKTIKIEKFGWSSNIVGGLGFVRSSLPSQANFEPIPTMAWLVSRTNRPYEHGLRTIPGKIGLGFGIHTVALDFDPNNSVEVGMGCSLHLFHDLVQLGYGFNLNIPHDRQYFFIGIRLFKSLK